MKNLYTLFLLLILFSFHSGAQFSNAYAPFHWTTTLSSGSTGTMNTGSAPASITLNGSDGAPGTDVDIDYSITAPASGLWSFNWSYHTNDADASFDIAGILINGSFTKLTDDAGGIDQSGSYTAPYVAAGTVIGFRVRSVDNGYGNATLSISNFAPPGGTLPLHLTSFDATYETGKVVLQWKTQNEMNVSYFETERSTNGSDFSTIRNIAARNTPQQHYTSTDENPYNGVNYYRLRMVDRDGKFSYSAVVPVRISKGNDLRLYPNPVNGQLTLQISSESVGDETVRIYDAAGRMLKTSTVTLARGMNSKVLDISLLSKGVYFVKLEKSGLIQSITKE